jgi:hypothetical protein
MYRARNIVQYLDRIIRREEGMDWFRNPTNPAAAKLHPTQINMSYLYIKQQ